MCVVSMIGDHYSEKFEPWKKYITTTNPLYDPTLLGGVSKIEFDALKKEVQEMKELLKKAKIYDEKNNEPNCEIEDKVKTLREIAKLVGIDLDDVLKSQNK